jgi:hypothetical protein
MIGGSPDGPDLPSVQTDSNAKARYESYPPPLHKEVIGKISSRLNNHIDVVWVEKPAWVPPDKQCHRSTPPATMHAAPR